MRPEGKGRHPVFLYIVGTMGTYNAPAHMDIVKYMAGKGFVAATIEYSNKDMCLDVCQDGGKCKHPWLSTGADVTMMEVCRKMMNAIDAICGLEGADCSKGLATMGHSQGGYISLVLGLVDRRVSAIHPQGIGGYNPDPAFTEGNIDLTCILDASMSLHVPRSKRLYINGEWDKLSNTSATVHDDKALEPYSGVHCNADRTPINCIQPDGSGYYIVAPSEYTDEDKAAIHPGDKGKHKLATHQYFIRDDPVFPDSELMPSYKHGSLPWHMKPTLDWLALVANPLYKSPLTESFSFKVAPKVSFVALLLVFLF